LELTMKPAQSVFRLCAVLALAGFMSVGCEPKKDPKNNTADPDAPPDPEVGYKEGLAALSAAKVDFAKAANAFANACQQAKDQGKQHPKACFNAGIATFRLGKLDDSERFYRMAIDADPAFKPAVQNLTVALLQARKAQDALPIFESFLKASPKDAEMRNNYAAALAEAGQKDAAVQQVRSLLFDDPKNTRAYKTLARIYFLSGDYLMSQMASGNALKLDPNDSDIHNNIGLAFLKQGREADAIVAFKEALKLNPENLEANMNLGILAVRSADYALAAASFNKVLEKFPGNAEARVGLAIAYRGTADGDAALAEYAKILQNDKCNQLALYNRATVLHLFPKQGNDKKAALEGAVKAYEEYARCHGMDKVGPQIDRANKDIADYLEERRQQEELERQMRELEEKTKVVTKELGEMLARAQRVWDKYKGTKKYDPSWDEEFGAQFEYGQMAIESEDYFTISEQKKYLDEYIQNYYKLALEMAADEWIGGGPSVEATPAPGADAAPAGATPAEGATAPAPAEGGAAAPAPSPAPAEPAPTTP
jgi:tetratricopeptide (TPR) repeat protein